MDAASNSGSTGSQALAARSSAATLKELRVHYPPIFPMATQRSRRVVREKFRKRTSSWTKKGNELAQMTGAEIYWVIHHNNKYYTYKSTDRPGWPPSEQEITNHNPRPFQRCPKDFETINEEREEDDDEGGEAEDRAQARFDGSKESRPQKASEKMVDQGRRIFTIPKPPVLRRTPAREKGEC